MTRKTAYISTPKHGWSRQICPQFIIRPTPSDQWQSWDAIRSTRASRSHRRRRHRAAYDPRRIIFDETDWSFRCGGKSWSAIMNGMVLRVERHIYALGHIGPRSACVHLRFSRVWTANMARSSRPIVLMISEWARERKECLDGRFLSHDESRLVK